MTTELDQYAWVAGALGDAACVTVVPLGDEDRVALAFGWDPEPRDLSPDDESMEYGVELGLATAGDHVLVVEDNGWEGSRAEVLRAASKASAAGVAASVFWNINGRETFTAARRGKLVCSVDLLECEPDDVPRALRRLARLASDDETDLVALAAAMVEKFTGVGFTREMLAHPTRRTYTAVPADLPTWPTTDTLLGREASELVETLLAAPVDTQRRLASWAARSVATEAGITEDPAVLAYLTVLDAGDVPPSAAGVQARLARWGREDQEWRNRAMYEPASTGALEESFRNGRMWAAQALVATQHPDPAQAALQSTTDAVWAYRCTRLERPGHFVDDDAGRHLEYDAAEHELPARAQAFADLALEGLSADECDWTSLTARLPRPLTADERDAAIRRDQERQAAGDFDTWQFSRVPD